MLRALCFLVSLAVALGAAYHLAIDIGDWIDKAPPRDSLGGVMVARITLYDAACLVVGLVGMVVAFGPPRAPVAPPSPQ